MRARAALAVLGKELRETLRDRRTLFMMVVLPTLLYPALFLAVEQMALLGQRRLGGRDAVVAVAGADRELAAFLARDPALRLAPPESASAAAVRGGGVEAAVVVEGAAGTRTARVLFDGSSDRSRRAQGLVAARLDAWGDTLLARRLRGAGLPPGFATPLAVRDSSVATAEETGGYALGRFLPVVLILMTLLGTFYPAIDLAAGEKERGTLETLLTAPVPAREIVAGKFAAVATIGFASAVANLASMLLTFQSGMFRFTQAAGVRFTVAPGSALVVLLGLVPLAVLFSALFLGVAVRSQSFKEAQNALTPVQLASTLPVFVISMPGIDFTPALAAVPVAGLAMLFRELMTGTAALLPSLVALLSTAAYAGLALAFAARAFGREEVLFGGGSGAAPRTAWGERLRAWRAADRGVPLPAEALAFIAVVALLFFHLGGRLQGALGERGLLLSEWLLLGLPAVAFAVAGPYDLRRTLTLRVPRPRALAGALLIALGGMPLGWAIGWLQIRLGLFPVDTELLQALERLVTATDLRRFLWLLFLVALTPAVCEELVFRGVLLQGLSREVRAGRAIVLTALVFGAFHVSFETAIRFIPTAWIGLLLGYVAWHTRSVLASMLMHFVNNGVAVAIVSLPALRGRVIGPGGEPEWALVAAAPLALAAGVWLLPRRADNEVLSPKS
ncbi:MAG TPA: ABC transporter permease subunit/CPBP intramembrane protease [Longimicrobiaceae bacterium]|nr:ABC transporter permease subunit/CPBP intramembrane protease [Longimicrobiaceae bacterium]